MVLTLWVHLTELSSGLTVNWTCSMTSFFAKFFIGLLLPLFWGHLELTDVNYFSPGASIIFPRCLSSMRIVMGSERREPRGRPEFTPHPAGGSTCSFCFPPFPSPAFIHTDLLNLLPFLCHNIWLIWISRRLESDSNIQIG